MKDTLLWYSIAKPNPTEQDAQSQLGVHLEEIIEMLEDGLGICTEVDVVQELKHWQRFYKNNSDKSFTEDMDKVALLDSICDQIVTATLLGKSLDMNVLGAFKEVEASNLSKFVHVGFGDISDLEWIDFDRHTDKIESEGRYKGVYWKRVGEYVVWYDGSGKILKGPKYFEPKLDKFIGE